MHADVLMLVKISDLSIYITIDISITSLLLDYSKIILIKFDLNIPLFSLFSVGGAYGFESMLAGWPYRTKYLLILFMINFAYLVGFCFRKWQGSKGKYSVKGSEPF